MHKFHPRKIARRFSAHVLGYNEHGNDEISSVLIKEKMRENERKRSLASVDPDLKPAQFQLLEDEHLALMLQNKEFLEILQQDEDFMKMLERDRMNATAFEPESPHLDPDRPPSEQIEGYGADRSDDVGVFPFSSPPPKDDTAEFRRQLKHMGGTSKKKVMALAKKFFTRKKKRTPKQLLKESVAPSTANLLEEDYSNDELPPRELEDDDDAMIGAGDSFSVPNHRLRNLQHLEDSRSRKSPSSKNRYPESSKHVLF